jgi:hypothetical protein
VTEQLVPAAASELPWVLSDLANASDPQLLERASAAVQTQYPSGNRYVLAGVGSGPLATITSSIALPTGPEQAPYVLRRDLPLQPLSGPGSLPTWAVGRQAETIGPLTGNLGQPVFIDLFNQVATTPLRRTSRATPFLVVAGPAPVANGTGDLTLSESTIWLQASLLDPAAPVGGWLGMTIAGGSIGGSSATPGPGGELVVPDGAQVVLAVEPVSPTATAGAGPGQDARDAVVDVPAKVEFILGLLTGQVNAIDPARLTAFGQTVRLNGLTGTVGYVADLASVLIPMQPDTATWRVAQARSTLATLAGGGALDQAGWALPVTVADSSTLGAASGAGAVAVHVDGLTLAFPRTAQPLPLGPTWLTAQPGQVTVAADAAAGTGATGDVLLYPDPAGGAGVGGRAAYRFADTFGLRHIISGTGDELLFAGASLDVSLDRPVAANGSRVGLSAPAGLIVFVEAPTGTTLLLEGQPQPVDTRTSIALDNALLNVADAQIFAVRAEVSETTPRIVAVHGQAVILFPLRGALPTLPDPYVSTLTPSARTRTIGSAAEYIRGPGGAATSASSSSGEGLLASLAWDATAGPAIPSLSFSLWPQPAGLVRSMAAADAPPQRQAVAVNQDAVTKDAEFLAQLSALVDRNLGAPAGPIALLDVSSNANQFGVRYGGATRGVRNAQGATGPTIEGLSIVAPARTVRVITLPAVQWEPVSGPTPGVFSPMSFPDSGGESQVAARSVRLVPAAPLPAMAQLLDDYADDTAPSGAVAALTFPFGIRAVAVLSPVRRPLFGGSKLDENQPKFSGTPVTGGHQLRATAVCQVLFGTANPSFPGAAVQLSNGLHNGVPTGLSPIDPLTGIFNGDFAPSGVEPRVPVRVFELSGYGETVFSDWKDDTDNVPAISEVRFDVLVGRTGVEIIQARSILYPYAVRVIRTIKMLRDNAGRVQRTDSGWQAVTDGRYRWPRAELHTHPGVVLGATRVINIRDTGQRWTSSAGTELMAVRFDCHVDLEGLVAGAGAGGVPSHDQLGFVQISVNSQPGMAATEFAELIEAFGPLGGAVDAVVDLGGSGQRTRVSHVGVGVTQAVIGPEFAMAAWGSPMLPTGGAWSVVRRGSADPAPGPVDTTLGVPVIRAGYAGSPPNPASPYRFADPADLASPASPAADYALLHTTPLQSTLYARPKVDVTGPRANQITSTLPPVLADAFLQATSVGCFPAVATAITFPDNDYGLRALGAGGLALDLAHNDFPVTGGDRTLNSAAGNTTLVRYRDEGGIPSTVHVDFDSSAAVPWTFSVTGVEICFATALLGEVIRFLGTEQGSAAAHGRFTGGTVHFGNALSAIQVFLDFLGRNNLADLPIGSQNQPSLEIALKIPIVGGPGEPEDIDVGIGTLADADVTVGVKVDLASGNTSLKFELGGIITGRTPFTPLVAAGQVKFEIESDSSGNVFKFTLGLGIGVQADIGPFKAEAYFFQNDYLVVGTNEIGFGIGEELKASIDLVIASAEVDVEAAALMIQTSCAGGTTLWLVAQLTIAVDITIAWVIDIDFEYQMQMQSNLDGGPCPAPMV